MIKPRVSIIIPVYNGSNYLQDAIESAINQDYCNYEIIVVNDGSTDNGKTEEIAMNYSNFIRYYEKENGGVASALNYGISKMEGDYFSWLSHDDIYYPNKLSSQINALYELGDLKTPVYSNYQLWDMNSNNVKDTSFHTMYSIEQLTNSIFPIIQWLTLSCTPLIHKSLFNEVGLFDESLLTAQDYDMWFRLFRNRRTIFVKEPLLKARIHSESGTKTIPSFKEELGKVLIESMQALSEHEVYKIYKNPAILYHRLAMILKSYELNYYYKIAIKKLHSTSIESSILEKLFEFDKYIRQISEGKAHRIVIFGAGQYGQRFYWELTSRLIYIDYFTDNNPIIWGNSIEGKSCISPNDLYKIKHDTLIIVAAQFSESIVAQLVEEECPYITTTQNLENELLNIIPLKWITALEERVSSNEITNIKFKFNQAIFDICKNFNTRKFNNNINER
jgi:glycosyltransferase involved in cell wall biosynthesis